MGTRYTDVLAPVRVRIAGEKGGACYRGLEDPWDLFPFVHAKRGKDRRSRGEIEENRSEEDLGRTEGDVSGEACVSQ